MVHFTINNKLKNDQPPDTLPLGGLDIFCKAAELKGFTAAAQSLGITPAAVSRSVLSLERRMGVQLFARTTRKIQLTEAGRDFHGQCRQALEQIADAARAATSHQHRVSGTVRVSVPATYAYYKLLPVLPHFLATYPQVQVDVRISGRPVDFMDGNLDLAILLGAQRDSRLIARPLEYCELGVFGHPDYLALRGVPRTVAELSGHDCISFVMTGTGRKIPWFFCVDGDSVEQTPNGSVCLREDPLAMVRLAASGAGLCQTFQYIAADDVAKGRLVEVLVDSRGRPRPYVLTYPQNPHLPRRIRAFIDFLVDTLGNRPNSKPKLSEALVS